LVEAGLSEEQVTTWAEPLEKLLNQWLQLLITQIHQQPIREHQVKTETERESVCVCERERERDQCVTDTTTSLFFKSNLLFFCCNL